MRGINKLLKINIQTDTKFRICILKKKSRMLSKHLIFDFHIITYSERPNSNSFVIDIIMRYYSLEFEITTPEVNMAKSCRCQINFAIIFYFAGQNISRVENLSRLAFTNFIYHSRSILIFSLHNISTIRWLYVFPAHYIEY